MGSSRASVAQEGVVPTVRKVRVGWQGVPYGTIEATPDGLKLEGDKRQLADFLDAVTMGDDPADAPGGLEGFLRYLASPSVHNGYNTVSEVREHGDEAT